MLDILKRIQSDVSEVKTRLGSVEARLGSVETKLGSVETRLGSVETVIKKMRRDNAGMLVMMRSTAGYFEERIDTLDADVGKLKAKVDTHL
jgi:septal ring factor EnvC (AmiA/AmiB activator)